MWRAIAHESFVKIVMTYKILTQCLEHSKSSEILIFQAFYEDDGDCPVSMEFYRRKKIVRGIIRIHFISDDF